MRITSIDLNSPNFSEAITFNLRAADPRSPYLVKNILGLDAEEIVSKFYGFGLNSNSKFYELGLKPRDIVLSAALRPRYNLDESVSDIRDELYRAISATRNGQVSLNFNSGSTLVARIFGFITKFEVPHFSKSPEVQLTVHCNDPMFRAVNPVQFTDTEISTSNPIIIPDSLSNAPHGFSMQATFSASTSSFTVQDDPDDPEWTFVVLPFGGFNSGDVLHFSSDFDNKSLYMVRSGTTTHLIDRISPSSIWPILFPGANIFYFSDLTKFDLDSIEYYAAYWGV